MSDKRIENAISVLIESKLEPGTLILAERLEELFGLKQTDHAFPWLISALRRGLYNYGLYLSGEGRSESGGFEVLHPRDNQWIARLAVAKAERDLEGKQTLLLHTNLDQLSNLERSRHEASLREISFKLEAMRRAEEVAGFLKKRKAKEAKTIEIEGGESGAEQS